MTSSTRTQLGAEMLLDVCSRPARSATWTNDLRTWKGAVANERVDDGDAAMESSGKFIGGDLVAIPTIRKEAILDVAEEPQPLAGDPYTRRQSHLAQRRRRPPE